MSDGPYDKKLKQFVTDTIARALKDSLNTHGGALMLGNKAEIWVDGYYTVKIKPSGGLKKGIRVKVKQFWDTDDAGEI